MVVKVPKVGHDMRFDIPVLGLRTLKSLRKAKVSCLAVEERGAIFLEKEAVVAHANSMGLSIVVLEAQR